MDISNSKLILPIKQTVKAVLTKVLGNNDYAKIVVITQARTGSTFLLSLLRCHPKIEFEGEVFRLLNGNSCKEIWNRIFAKRLPWIKYVGFKIFYYHPDDSDDNKVWNFIAEDEEVRIIHLKRNDLLRTYISKQLAFKTGLWTSKKQKKHGKPLDKRIQIDVDHCLKELNQIKEWERSHSKENFPNHHYFETSYETVTGDYQSTVNELFNFLALKPIRVKSELRRQNPEKIEDLITNYDELKSHLSNSGYAYLFE